MNCAALILSVILIQTSSLDCSSIQTRTVQFDFYSGLDDWVVGYLHPNGANAVAVDNSLIRDSSTNALLIWESPQPYNYAITSTIYVSKSFYIPGSPIWAQLIIKADDSCSVKMNDVATSCGTDFYTEIRICDLSSFIVSGNNVISITVVNIGGSAGNAASLTYKLSVKTSVNLA